MQKAARFRDARPPRPDGRMEWKPPAGGEAVPIFCKFRKRASPRLRKKPFPPECRQTATAPRDKFSARERFEISVNPPFGKCRFAAKRLGSPPKPKTRRKSLRWECRAVWFGIGSKKTPFGVIIRKKIERFRERTARSGQTGNGRTGRRLVCVHAPENVYTPISSPLSKTFDFSQKPCNTCGFRAAARKDRILRDFKFAANRAAAETKTGKSGAFYFSNPAKNSKSNDV